MSATKRLLGIALVMAIATPAFAQTKKNERQNNGHWVATWATALVARPLPAAGRGAGPGGPPAPTAPPAAPNLNAPPPSGPAPAGAAAPSGPAPTGPASAGPAPAAGRGGGRGFAPPVTVTNQTIRQIVHTSIGGSRLRVVLSNAFGTAPIDIGAAHVGLRDRDNALVAASVKPLTVGGSSMFTILAGATVVSDAVDLMLPPLSDLAIDLYVPGDIGVGPSPVTTHNGASQTNYVSSTGNHSGVVSPDPGIRAGAWFMIARVEVLASPTTGAIVAFGDSITDGARSTSDINGRWPDQLARRLAARKGPAFSVLNAGISGNRVLGDGAGVSALARFDRDVLMQTGVTHVIVLEGINDIGIAGSNPTPSATDLINGHKQLIERAHARGLKIYGATLTPYEGAAYFTAEGEAKRQALNQWIRTSGAYDGVIDFDMATRDPMSPTKFLPAYDSGDHLHPGDAGYKAMGDAIDLGLFK
jgi:lysophospholipase L1-like esterase